MLEEIDKYITEAPAVSVLSELDTYLVEFNEKWKNRVVKNIRTNRMVKVGSLAPEDQEKYKPKWLKSKAAKDKKDNLDEYDKDHKLRFDMYVSMPNRFDSVEDFLEGKEVIIGTTSSSDVVNMFDKEDTVLRFVGVPVKCIKRFNTLKEGDNDIAESEFKDFPKQDNQKKYEFIKFNTYRIFEFDPHECKDDIHIVDDTPDEDGLVLYKKSDEFGILEAIQYFTEKVGDDKLGHTYEVFVHKKVRKACQDPRLKGILKVGKNPTFQDTISSFSHDMLLNYKGQDLPIEIKLNVLAPVGYTSFTHEIGTDEFIPIQEVDEEEKETMAMIIKSLQEQVPTIANLYKKMKNATPKSLWSLFTGKFSATVPKVGWDSIEDKKQLPTQIIDSKFVERHYNKKGIYYIQIGGSGLYYLGKDILGLGVPRYEAQLKIETRLRGSGEKFGQGISKVTIQLISTGRAVGKIEKSPYSLDDVDDVITLFGESR